MRTDIDSVEVRQKVGGGLVVDVIYTNGIKVKLDPKKLEKEKAKLEKHIASKVEDVAVIDDALAFIEAEVAKSPEIVT